MSLHVAIATYVSTGAYDANTIDEDALLSKLLEELGISHQLLAWSDPDVDWSRFTHVLIKSTWDYFDYYPEFLAWLNQLEFLGIPILNNVDTLRWNSSKKYLLEVKSKGYPCVAGKILPKGTVTSLKELHDALQSDTLVVKPLISGGAKNTVKISRGAGKELEQKIASLLEEEAFLVQPYIPEIVEVGEYSLIYFNVVFSHAVLKSPAADDFRVQHYYGGTIQEIQPDSKMLAAAQALVDAFAKDSLYTRVDGVVIDGVFHLMELELIEPYLFLGLSDKAIPNYKAALRKRLLGS
ncbi:MAG: glutathione synthetase [Bacteroidetes bacterium]|nr:glutathione synthetase [Bacteroidota bacterium]